MINQSPPITPQQIQNEYGRSGIVASSTPAGLDPLPTAMLDFLGKSSAPLGLLVPGYNGHQYSSYGSYYQSVNGSYTMAHAGMEFLSNNYGLAGLTNGVWQSNHDYSIDFAVEGGGWCDNTTQSYEIRLRGVQNPFGVVVNLYPGGPNAPRPWQSLRGQYVAVEYGFNVYDYQPTTYGGGTFIVEMRKQGTTGPVVTSSWYSEAYIYFV